MMQYLVFISFSCLPIMSCMSGTYESNSSLVEDLNIHRPHIENILRQIQNDKIIQAQTMPTKTVKNYILDNKELSESDFQSLEKDTFFYLERKMSYVEELEGTNPSLEVIYEGYTTEYYSNHQFTPESLMLSFDENDLLVFSLSHSTEGELFVYGFDKDTGKQGLPPYSEKKFIGDFTKRNSLHDRKINELRLVISLNDSLYIHDFEIEAFYTHEH